MFVGCDVDADNDESLVDFYWFQSVFGYSPLKWNSIVFDSDDNGQINLADFNFFAPRMTGPHP